MDYIWKDKTEEFKTIDVRNLKNNFFDGLYKKAKEMEIGKGIEVIQTFIPHPLCESLEKIGYEYYTEKADENEFHTYFYRAYKKETNEAPYRPLALLNYPMIDKDLGKVAVDFWDATWNDDKRYLDYETRLLLSLTNAVGAGRIRQATRELVKAYSHGLNSKALDDVFELIAWNQGIGYFSSEIGPTPLFKSYKLIKNLEEKNKTREEIVEKLQEEFGENNKNISVQ